MTDYDELTKKILEKLSKLDSPESELRKRYAEEMERSRAEYEDSSQKLAANSTMQKNTAAAQSLINKKNTAIKAETEGLSGAGVNAVLEKSRREKLDDSIEEIDVETKMAQEKLDENLEKELDELEEQQQKEYDKERKALEDELEEVEKQKEEAERKAQEEAERKAQEEAERKAQEEAERKAQEEAERKAQEEAERKAQEEAERKAQEEAERKAQEEAERKAQEEAERKAQEEAEKKAQDEDNDTEEDEEKYKPTVTAKELAKSIIERFSGDSQRIQEYVEELNEKNNLDDEYLKDLYFALEAYGALESADSFTGTVMSASKIRELVNESKLYYKTAYGKLYNTFSKLGRSGLTLAQSTAKMARMVQMDFFYRSSANKGQFETLCETAGIPTEEIAEYYDRVEFLKQTKKGGIEMGEYLSQ